MTSFKLMRSLMIWTLLLTVVARGEEAAVKKETLAVPSEKEIKSFVTSAKLTPESKETVELVVNAKLAVLPKRAMEAYRQKGKIPFSISVELNKNKETEEGTEKQSIFDCSANIVVADKDGKIVSQKTEDLSALCPS
jgi:hypothetical protein